MTQPAGFDVVMGDARELLLDYRATLAWKDGKIGRKDQRTINDIDHVIRWMKENWPEVQ